MIPWQVIPGEGIRSPNTLRIRQRVLPAFWGWMEAQAIGPEGLTLDHVNAWIAKRLAAVKASSVVTELSAIRMWLKRWRKDLVLDWDQVTVPSFTAPEPRALTEEEDLRVMNLARKTEAYLLFAWCRWAGLRVGEALHVRWSSITSDGAKRMARIEPVPGEGGWDPKTRKVRVVPISSPLWQALIAAREVRDKHHSLPEVCVWEDPQGGWHPWRKVPWRPWNDIRTRVRSIPKRAAWHCLRKTFATRAAQRGVRLEIIQRWLGHSSVQTTLAYLDTSLYASEGLIDKTT